MPRLLLMRHGATAWAAQNRFAGWADAPLSKKGQDEARRAGFALAKAGIEFDLCHTSLLSRSRLSLECLLQGYGQEHLPRQAYWRLNERHYGALQGESRLAMVKRYGHDKILAWRRAFEATPPPLEQSDPRWQEQLSRLPEVPFEAQPSSESLKTAALRLEAYWEEDLGPLLKEGRSLLVVAHSSSLRGLTRVIEGLDDAQSEAFRIATALPRVYELDKSLSPISRRDIAPDPKAAWRNFANRFKPRWISWI